MKLVRILILVLAFSILLTSAVACTSNDDQNAGNATKGQSSGESTADLYDQDGYLKDQIPDELDYEGKELSVLCWASSANEFACDDLNGQTINDALVRRDLNVEDRLNVSLNYLTNLIYSGSIAEVNHYIELVKKASQAGDYYDLMALYGRSAAILSTDGYLQNILNIDKSYLDFENPWWTPNLLDELVVGDSLYMVSGDITPSLYEQAYTLFYNVDMINDFKLKDPYDHVKENTWTLENFRTMIKDIRYDQNGDPAYGFVSISYTVPSMFHGCGIRITEMDENQIPHLSDDLFSERTIDIVDDLQEWFREYTFLVDKKSATPRKLFTDGNALFSADIVLECFNFVESCQFAYSAVPNPKLTSEQDRYYTTLSGFTFFCLMRGHSQEDLTMFSAVLECMGSEAYRLTSPAVLDICLKSRYAQTEKMSEMLTLVTNSVYYDFGRICSSIADNFICDRVGLIIMSPTDTWSAYRDANQEALEKRFQEMADQYAANAG